MNIMNEIENDAAIASLHVGVVYWQPEDGIGSAIFDSVCAWGCETVHFLHNETIPDGLDVILVYGPFNSLTPLSQQLLAYPPDSRPALILWMSEQLSNPSIPDWLLRPSGQLRSWAERQSYQLSDAGVWQPNPRWQKLTCKAHRLRYYGDLHWLKQQGLLTVLGIGSQWITQYLQQRGLNPVTAYFGSFPEWWGDLNLERDIPVLWLGKTGSDRRKTFLSQLQDDLQARGVEMTVVDGVSHPYVFGKERTVLLNRSRIVVNILRTPWDNHSIRFFLSSSNKALIISEPTLPHTPFMPGEHFVETPIERMAETIYYHLNHPEAGAPLVERSFQLATQELTMFRSVGSLLQQAVQQRNRAFSSKYSTRIPRIMRKRAAHA